MVFVTQDEHIHGIRSPFREHPLLPGKIQMQAEPEMVIGESGQGPLMSGPDPVLKIPDGTIPGPDDPGMGQQPRIVEYP